MSPGIATSKSCSTNLLLQCQLLAVNRALKESAKAVDRTNLLVTTRP